MKKNISGGARQAKRSLESAVVRAVVNSDTCTCITVY